MCQVKILWNTTAGGRLDSELWARSRKSLLQYLQGIRDGGNAYDSGHEPQYRIAVDQAASRNVSVLGM